MNNKREIKANCITAKTTALKALKTKSKIKSNNFTTSRCCGTRERRGSRRALR
jgi:hypothetical protein